MKVVNRREFLRGSTLGMAAVAAGVGLTEHVWATPYGMPIGLQLYTLRNELPKDLAGTLQKVAEIGYKEVELFDFYGKTLRGIPEDRPRWKRGVELVEGSLGEALGRIYVGQHFPPRNKARMQELVRNLLSAYRQSITRLDWMSPRTKQQALAKLAKFTPKIGPE